MRERIHNNNMINNKSTRRCFFSCGRLLGILIFFIILNFTSIWYYGHSVQNDIHKIITGEWISSDGIEYIKIDYIASIELNDRVEYRYAVTAKGCRIFRTEYDNDNENLPKNYFPLKNSTGSLTYCRKFDNDSITIEWDNIAQSNTTFGIAVYGMIKEKLYLFTYTKDPDTPFSEVKLYKK